MLVLLIFDWGKHIRKIRKKPEFFWVWGCFLGCCVGFFIVHWYVFSCIHRPGWFWAFRGLVSIFVLSVKASVGFSLGNNTGKSNKLWKKEKIITWPPKNPCSWFGLWESGWEFVSNSLLLSPRRWEWEERDLWQLDKGRFTCDLWCKGMRAALCAAA